MAKFLETNLLGDEVIVPEPVKIPGMVKGKGKQLRIAVLLAVLVIAVALGGVIVLPKIIDKASNGNNIVERPKPPPPKPDTTTSVKPVPKPPPTKSKGLKEVPWIGATAELFDKLSGAKGSLYSIATGPEGVVLFSGVVPGESAKVDSGGELLPGANLTSIKVLSVYGVTGGVKYVASASMVPLKEIDYDPKPVPPYRRGQVLRQLDSLARAAGLTDVQTEAVGREEVEGGSRYLIAVRCMGELGQINKFLHSADDVHLMMEVGRFSLEGATGKSIEEDKLAGGFVFRVYDLPIPKDEPQQAVTDSSKASPDTISS